MAELKPTDKELAMIASEYCRLQFGINKCSKCPAFNCACSWLRERIIPRTAVAFVIDAWNHRRKICQK